MTLSVGFVGIAIFALGVSFVRVRVRVLCDRDATPSWPLAIIVFELLGTFTEAYVGIPNWIGSMCFLVALLYPLRTPEAPERRSQRASRCSDRRARCGRLRFDGSEAARIRVPSP